MKSLFTLLALTGLWCTLPSGVPSQEMEHAFDSAIGSMAGVVPPVKVADAPDPPNRSHQNHEDEEEVTQTSQPLEHQAK